MKVLIISGDTNALVPGNSVYARLDLLKEQVERLDVFVWPQVHSKRTIWRSVRENHYGVITTQDPFWRGLLAWKLARLTGAKLNVQVHTDLAAQSFFRRVIARVVLRHADSIRTVSEKIREQVHALGVHVPIHVLPIFVDIDAFKTLSPKPHEQKTILWVGRFEPEKDPLAAIHVLKEVREKGVGAKLVMLGSGSLEGVLRKSAAGLPVEFPGWQDSKPFLQTADVVLSTSKHESWGASIVEALAAGVPVVAPDVGIAKEAGALVVPRPELASAVERVLQSGERGVLKLSVPTATAWAHAYAESLT